MPQAPLLTEVTDSHKLEEIRRTVFISNMDKTVSNLQKMLQ